MYEGDFLTNKNFTHVCYTFRSMAFFEMSVYRLPHMIDMLITLIQLGAISVSAQHCNSTLICRYANVEGVSPLFREFPRPGHHSCLWHCTHDTNCEAVTHDRTLDICRFHFGADGIACMQILPASGKSLGIITEYDHNNARCYKVTYLDKYLYSCNFFRLPKEVQWSAITTRSIFSDWIFPKDTP